MFGRKEHPARCRWVNAFILITTVLLYIGTAIPAFGFSSPLDDGVSAMRNGTSIVITATDPRGTEQKTYSNDTATSVSYPSVANGIVAWSATYGSGSLKEWQVHYVVRDPKRNAWDHGYSTKYFCSEADCRFVNADGVVGWLHVHGSSPSYTCRFGCVTYDPVSAGWKSYTDYLYNVTHFPASRLTVQDGVAAFNLATGPNWSRDSHIYYAIFDPQPGHRTWKSGSCTDQGYTMVTPDLSINNCTIHWAGIDKSYNWETHQWTNGSTSAKAWIVAQSTTLSDRYLVWITDQSTAPSTSTWELEYGDGSWGNERGEYHRYFTAGTYTITQTVNAPNGYSTHSTSISLGTGTTLTASNASGRPDETVQLSATLKTSSGTNLGGKQVRFTVDGGGAMYATTTSSGVATVSYSIPSSFVIGSTHQVHASFTGDFTYQPTSGNATLTVNKYTTSLDVADVSGVTNQTVNLQATLSTNGPERSGKTVSFTVNGVAAGSGITNSSGIATASFAIPPSFGNGTKTITATFAGNSQYLGSTDTGSLNVGVASTQISVAPTSGNNGTSVSLEATLTSGSVYLSGKTLTFKITNGSTTTTLGTATTNSSGIAIRNYTIPTDMSAGGKTITVEFAGDSSYGSSQGTGTLTVNGTQTQLTVSPVSGAFGATVTLGANLSKLSDGTKLSSKVLSFTVGGVAAGSGTTNSNGDATVSFKVADSLTTGANTIAVAFAGEGVYGSSTGSGTLTASKANTAVSVENKSGNVNTSVTLVAWLTRTTDNGPVSGRALRFKVTKRTTGVVTTIGTQSTGTDGSASISWTIPADFSVGANTITIEFDGDSRYNLSTQTGTLTVNNPNMTTPVIYIQQPATCSIRSTIYLRASINNYWSGISLRFKVDGETIGTPTTSGDGWASCGYECTETRGVGTKTITVEFDGNAQWNPTTATGTLTVNKASTSINSGSANYVQIGARVYPYAQLSYRMYDGYSYNPLGGKTLTFTVNGQVIGNGVTDGQYGGFGMWWTVPDDPAWLNGQNILATFTEDNYYLGSTAQYSVSAIKAYMVLTPSPAGPYSGSIGQQIAVGAYLRRDPSGSDGLYQPGKTLTFQVKLPDGTLIPIGDAVTNSSGRASLNYVISDIVPAGANKIRISYAGNAVNNSRSIEVDFTVSKSATTLQANDLSGQIGQMAPLTATLIRSTDQGKPAGRTVDFLIDGVSIGTAVTNENGVAVLNYLVPESLGLGSELIFASFAGDDQYTDSAVEFALHVVKGDTSVTVTDAVGQIGQTVPVSAKLTCANDGPALNGKALRFEVEGVPAGTATTDSQGVATLNYTIPDTFVEGGKTINVYFDENDYYTATSGSGTLTVSKAVTELVALDVAGQREQTVVLSANLTRSASGTPADGKLVAFSVDATAVGTSITDSMGLASLSYEIPIGMSIGQHTVTAAFTEDDHDLASTDNAVLTVWQLVSPAVAKTQPNGSPVRLDGVVVTGAFNGFFYVEQPDRACGIRVAVTSPLTCPAQGNVVTVVGTMATATASERCVNASEVIITSTTTVPGSLGMNNRSLGGGKVGTEPLWQKGVLGLGGLNNIGLLVQVWGRVLSIGTTSFSISDGGTYTVRVEISPVPSGIAVNDYVKVTGISSVYQYSTYLLSMVRPRSENDIELVTDWVVSPSNTIALQPDKFNLLAMPGIPKCPAPGSVFASCQSQPSIDLNGNLTRYDAYSQVSVYYGIYHNGEDPFGNCLVGDGFGLTIQANGSQCYNFEWSPVDGDQWISLPKGMIDYDNITVIGNPFDESVSWSACSVTDGSRTLSFAAAMAAGWITQIDEFNVTAQEWVQITDFSGNMLARRGYIVHSGVDNLALIIPDPSP